MWSRLLLRLGEEDREGDLMRSNGATDYSSGRRRGRRGHHLRALWRQSGGRRAGSGAGADGTRGGGDGEVAGRGIRARGCRGRGRVGSRGEAEAARRGFSLGLWGSERRRRGGFEALPVTFFLSNKGCRRAGLNEP